MTKNLTLKEAYTREGVLKGITLVVGGWLLLVAISWFDPAFLEGNRFRFFADIGAYSGGVLMPVFIVSIYYHQSQLHKMKLDREMGNN